jgi:hypothetical protein
LIVGSVGAGQQAAACIEEKGDHKNQDRASGKTFNHAPKLIMIFFFSSRIHQLSVFEATPQRP